MDRRRENKLKPAGIHCSYCRKQILPLPGETFFDMQEAIEEHLITFYDDKPCCDECALLKEVEKKLGAGVKRKGTPREEGKVPQMKDPLTHNISLLNWGSLRRRT